MQFSRSIPLALALAIAVPATVQSHEGKTKEAAVNLGCLFCKSKTINLTLLALFAVGYMRLKTK